MQDGFVATAHGRLHYLRTGQKGPPLVLMHSNGASAYEYEHVIDTLGRSNRVFAWDMPGHGDSEPIARHYTIDDYADAAAAFIAALDLPRATFLGSSVGGSICLSLGQRHGDRLESLVIVETPTRSAAEWEKMWGTIEEIFGIATQSAEAVAPRLRSLTPALLRRWNIDRNKAGAKLMTDVVWAVREFNACAALSAVSTRSLVIFGETGPVMDGKANFERLMPTAPIRVVKGCGHFPMIDDPEQFCAIVTDFLNGEGRSTSPA